MKWLKSLFKIIICWFEPQKETKVAKVILDDFHEKLFEFELSTLIYIGYSKESDCIILVVGNDPPKYLPLTDGNIDFLQMLTPYLRSKLANDLKMAEESLAQVSKKPK